MASLLGRRFAKLRRSYEKRRKIIVDKRLTAEGSLAKLGFVSRADTVLFVGYAEAALGLGEAFRNMLAALDSAGMPFAIYPFNKDVETRRIGPFLEQRYDRDGIHDINVAYLAVDQLEYYYSELRKQVTGARYNVLRTYWELGKAPAQWEPLLQGIDELWVPNSFVSEAFRPIFDRKIVVVPTCVNVKKNKVFTRGHFGLEDNRFYFMFSFDYYSGTARKNPLGLARAFGYAFPDLNENVGLLIKSTGPGELDPVVWWELANLAQIDKRVRILTASLDRDEMLSLIACTDCYISLHRSEGFGLGMAEALALEKPVIGTDYSGNRDFLTEATGFPVAFGLRGLMPGEYRITDAQNWAEPDPRAAVQCMRSVFVDREEGHRRASRGRQFIEDRYSEETVARAVMDRVGEIRAGFAKKG